MGKRVRLIYTISYQDGVEHWSQGYATFDTEIDLPETIKGRPLLHWNFVGLEFEPNGRDK